MPGEAGAGGGMGATVRVWDPLLRVLHWTLAAGFLGAFALTSPRGTHETLGWIAVAAAAARILWGFAGPRRARFADFVPGPAGLLAYARAVLRGTEPRHLGHNPAGGAMVVALLAVVAGLGATGWMMGLDRFWGAGWLEELHETIADLGVGLVVLHWLGVAWESLRHRENLVLAMITGRKRP
ncbi:cytochrome b/b6 domain-containing protein [Amaricoccus sp.]|uniref:cytochrome b/b6 domain-containing protein n=1 Tax=Amaricoccus sp. TaxID=1872485 RepID=UPI001B65CE8F|nr:cytochrome b/b6 domain-containing protein [Amaricoccus sp.]MBP7000327.1 cytochrome b/b6 domain-containing protein [Amaricoccus sp.]